MDTDQNHYRKDSRGSRLRLKPGAVVPLLGLVVVAWLITPLYDLFAAPLGAPERVVGAELFTTLFLVVYLGGIVAHEVGHVLAARRYGGELGHVVLGVLIAVHLHLPNPRTNAAQASISMSGPGAQILAALVCALLAAGCGPWALGALVAAVLTLIEGGANLLLPLHRTSDASKLYLSLWRIARGRAQHPFLPGPI